MIQRCLVLGGGGFIGSHLCDALLAAKYTVTAFDRPVPESVAAGRAGSAVRWIYGDYQNRDDVRGAIAACDVVFHLISTTLPKTSNDSPVYDINTNLVSTVNMLDLAREAGVKRIIFVSSGGTVYGPSRDALALTEAHPTNPTCSYGIVKLAIEKYLRLYNDLHGLDYSILRVSNPFGAGQRLDAAQGAITIFANLALQERPIDVWGDGSTTRDYVHISDVINALVLTLRYQGPVRLMNIGSGNGRSINDILDAISSVVGRKIHRNYLPARPFDVPSNVLDCTLASEELGWVSKMPLKEGLRQTVDWLRQNADRQS